jgi:hypothetical protein
MYSLLLMSSASRSPWKSGRAAGEHRLNSESESCLHGMQCLLVPQPARVSICATSSVSKGCRCSLPACIQGNGNSILQLPTATMLHRPTIPCFPVSFSRSTGEPLSLIPRVERTQDSKTKGHHISVPILSCSRLVVTYSTVSLCCNVLDALMSIRRYD